jgi:osmotically-inducible protein OsmY
MPTRRPEDQVMNSAAKAQPCSEATDADLARTVHRALCANRNGCSRIVVRVEEGSVRLSEPVRSFFLRQTAIALAKQVAGVRQVIDDVEVDGEEIRPH